jgi:hypothetical protein
MLKVMDGGSNGERRSELVCVAALDKLYFEIQRSEEQHQSFLDARQMFQETLSGMGNRTSEPDPSLALAAEAADWVTAIKTALPLHGQAQHEVDTVRSDGQT